MIHALLQVQAAGIAIMYVVSNGGMPLETRVRNGIQNCICRRQSPAARLSPALSRLAKFVAGPDG